MSKIISGGNLPNIPWQEKPADCWLPIWRYSANPVIGRNPFPGMGRIYNSAVIPWQGKFKGVFRAESQHLHVLSFTLATQTTVYTGPSRLNESTCMILMENHMIHIMLMILVLPRLKMFSILLSAVIFMVQPLV